MNLSDASKKANKQYKQRAKSAVKKSKLITRKGMNKLF